MSILIVTYSLTHSVLFNNREEKLTEKITKYTYARLAKNAYLIISTAEPVEVRDYLIQGLINGDQLYVGIANAPAAWTGLPSDVSDWIKNNLQ